jgi:nicotinamide-nucleotide amidase
MAEALDPAIPDEVDALACAVLQTACGRKLSLATAESCTGGLLASLLTDIPGLSHAFERGFVVYASEAKAEMLGVHPSLLKDPGPVSEVVARAMAEGAIAHSHADLALSITGFAGRSAPGDPVGLVHFACAARDGQTFHEIHQFGDIGRGAIRLECLRVGLEVLQKALRA